MLIITSDRISNLWNVRLNVVSSICVLALRLCWLLVGESRSQPLERGGTSILFVYVHPSLPELIHWKQVRTQRQDVSTAQSARISFTIRHSTMYSYPRLSTLKKSIPGSKVWLLVQGTFLSLMPRSSEQTPRAVPTMDTW